MPTKLLFITPAKAGVQGKLLKSLNSCLRGNDEQGTGEPASRILAQPRSHTTLAAAIKPDRSHAARHHAGRRRHRCFPTSAPLWRGIGRPCDLAASDESQHDEGVAAGASSSHPDRDPRAE